MSGIDKFLIIRIGGEKGKHDAFKRIADLQTELCRTDPRFVLVSTLLSGVGDDHMVDKYHYDQAVLNLLGADADYLLAFREAAEARFGSPGAFFTAGLGLAEAELEALRDRYLGDPADG